MRKIYYAHPVNMYGTLVETAFLQLVADYLANGNIDVFENPNQPHHQEGYNRYAKRQKESDANHKGMGYFYNEVIEPKCGNGCVGVPFLDGLFGLGVAGEMKLNIELGRPTWIIVASRVVIAPDDLDCLINDPFRSIFSARPITGRERELIRNLDKERTSEIILSHLETRLRTWKVYNKVMRPYEEAHLVKMPIPSNFYPNG